MKTLLWTFATILMIPLAVLATEVKKEKRIPNLETSTEVQPDKNSELQKQINSDLSNKKSDEETRPSMQPWSHQFREGRARID